MTAGARHIVLAAGGTGGHVFPARALAEALLERGHRVALVTDRRGDEVGAALAGVQTHRISAASPSGGVVAALSGLARLALGAMQARALLRREAPDAVVGFGGYPSVPTVWAACRLGIPCAIHEQNAVIGRANRLLAPGVQRIATSFAEVARLRPADASKLVHTGNPVRAAVSAVGALPYPAASNGSRKLRILVLGGSQGARVLSRVVPPALAALPRLARERLSVAQQCRPEDLASVRTAYRAAGIDAELAAFFDDVPQRLGETHLVIARAGASTVAELSAAGRPAILVPYPHAADDHQTANAQAAEAAGGVWPVAEPAFTAEALTARIGEFLDRPSLLSDAAARQRAAGRPDAARRLADLVEALCDPDRNGAGMRGEDARDDREAAA